jgi:hypothetical protein
MIDKILVMEVIIKKLHNDFPLPQGLLTDNLHTILFCLIQQ